MNDKNDNNEYQPLIAEQHWAGLKKKFQLTSREVQIAKLACSGFNNEDIALKLEITAGTVKTHLRNIYRKTWVHNKVQMLLKFTQHAC